MTEHWKEHKPKPFIDNQKFKLTPVWTNQSGLNQTLAGGLALQRHLHHFKQVPIRAAEELLVCSDPDLWVLTGRAVQLQQHRPLEGRKPLSAAGVRVTLTSSPSRSTSFFHFGCQFVNKKMDAACSAVDSRQLSRESV